MRSAETQRHAEALRRADGDIRAEFTGRAQQREREKIGRDDGVRADRVRGGEESLEIVNRAGRIRILDEHAETVCCRSRYVRWSPTTTLMPSGVARVLTMSIVWGWQC